MLTNIKTALLQTALYIDSDVPVFLWGAPGIGKSDGAREIGKARGLMVHDWRANLRDPVDGRGLPIVDAATATTTWARPSDLPFVGNDQFPDEGILFLDELNTASPAMQTLGFQLVLERCIGEHKLKSGWRIVAAGNRQTDRGTAQRMPSPLANRFAHVYCEADVAAWCEWAARSGIHPALLAFVRFRPALLHLMPGATPADPSMPAIPADAVAFPTPRAYAAVSKVAHKLDSMPATDADKLRRAAFGGIIGDGPAGELNAFWAMYHRAPKIADILANPGGIVVPNEPGILYAVASALARKADRKNFSAIVEFGERIPAAFRTALVTDAVRRDSALQSTAAFATWASANSNVIL